MKKSLILFVTFLSLMAFTTPPAEFSIIGKWEGTVEGEKFGMEFDKDGYATLQKGDQRFGGKEFDMGGEKIAMTYEVDYKATPNLIKISLKRLSTGEKELMFTIGFRPLNDNEFKANIADEDKTPDIDGPDAVVYKRK
ncbi:hypothetical protein AM493_08975 [Flavobacterium akiainvivens]|uniref:DUF5640 domain-containing protein n=1 Tax=Flavobacterium akiainvivens TaxID=1202724 RepID=A0A0M9VI07_9FLAO|nr:hypothetical protein [Flavobacterium akiainvivens]KOS06150.1 hypothetical protein AM493_08975 [Flavobacterium akiainvivens]SFQ67950.1 hypothetical protein SAMN05444144_11429 [Flavobacterium akiainvivens]